MEVSRILEEIDAQISKLQQARELLSGTVVKISKGRGRPQGKQECQNRGEGCATQTKDQRRRPQAHCRSHEEALGRAQKTGRKAGRSSKVDVTLACRLFRMIATCSAHSIHGRCVIVYLRLGFPNNFRRRAIRLQGSPHALGRTKDETRYSCAAKAFRQFLPYANNKCVEINL